MERYPAETTGNRATSGPSLAEDHTMDIALPRWSPTAFLVYAGGFMTLGAAGGWLGYFSLRYGDAAYAGWAFVVYVLLGGTAYGLLRRGHQVAAGVFAFAAVIGFAAFLAALFNWFGWLGHQGSGSTFAGFHAGRLVVELATLGAAAKALRIFRHPLLMLPVVLLAWLLVTDFLSGGGTWSAIVTLSVGLVFFASALSADAGPRRPYGFWLHLAAGLTIGGSLLFFWHSGTFDWILVAIRLARLHPARRGARPCELGRARSPGAHVCRGVLHAQVVVGHHSDLRTGRALDTRLGAAARLRRHRRAPRRARIAARPPSARRDVDRKPTLTPRLPAPGSPAPCAGSPRPPSPRRRARLLRSARMRRARSSSASVGAKISLTTAIWAGWMHHFPS